MRDFYFQRSVVSQSKPDHTRNRQPIIVPNDDYENNNTSSVSPLFLTATTAQINIFRARQKFNKNQLNSPFPITIS